MKHLLLLVILLSGSSSLKAQSNWFVSPTGSDQPGNGTTLANPFRSLEYAADSASPGDTVQVLAGTYSNPNFGDGDKWKDEITVSLRNVNGAPNQSIVFKAYQGQQVIFKGDSRYIFHLRNCSYVRIEGFEMAGEVENILLDSAQANQFVYKDSSGNVQYRVPLGTPDSIVDTMSFPVISGITRPLYYDTKGLLVQNSHHIEIVGNHMHHCPGTGLRFNGCDYIQVIGNEVNDCSRRSSVGTHGLVFDSSTDIDSSSAVKIVIARNRVHHNYNEVYSWNQGKTFITPLIDEGKGISMQRNDSIHGWVYGRIRIENNLTYRNGFSGIHSNQGERMDIVNNTVWYNSFSGRGNNIGISVARGKDFRIVNNISVADTSFGGFALSTALTSNLSVENNLVWGLLDPDIDSIDLGTRLAHPLFGDTLDFPLSAASPAIDQALGAEAPERDFLGALRDSFPDIGAVEYFAPLRIESANTAVGLVAFPNPFNDGLMLRGLNSEVEFEVYNVEGRRVTEFVRSARTGSGEIRMDFRTLGSGIYYVVSRKGAVLVIKE